MKRETVEKTRTRVKRDDAEVQETEVRIRTGGDREQTLEDIDELLDEIDEVLEHNAGQIQDEVVWMCPCGFEGEECARSRPYLRSEMDTDGYPMGTAE